MARRKRPQQAAPTPPTLPDLPPLKLVYVDPATLEANPLNWRIHPESQRAALAQQMGQVGWVKPLIFNELTGRFVDGHMRRDMFAGVPVPVIFGSWNESQERTILATLDPLGDLAAGDSSKFAELLDLCDATGPELLGLLGQTADALGIYADVDGSAPDDGSGGDEADSSTPSGAQAANDDSAPVRTRVPDCVFPSSNDFGIPDLNPNLQAEFYDFPSTSWRSQSSKVAMPGTWTFYIDDYRFEPLWDNPDTVLLSKPKNCIEPNFSTHEQHPMAYQIWQTYRKRWIARWWQKEGIRIFVDLNVARSARQLNLIGVPEGWRAYANRAHGQGEGLLEEFQLAQDHAGTKDVLYLVYGGGGEVRALAKKHGWHWVPEQFDQAKGKYKETPATRSES